MGLTRNCSLYLPYSVQKINIPDGLTKVFWITIILPFKGGIDVGGGGAESQEIGIFNPDGIRIGYNWGAWHPDQDVNKQYCRISLQGLDAGTYTIILSQDTKSTIDANHGYGVLDNMTMHAFRYVYPQPPVALPNPQFGLYNTGQGRFIGHGNPVGTIDPSYFYFSGGVETQAVVTSKPEWFVSGENDPVSTWIIVPYLGAGVSYFIGTRFDLSGYDPSTVTLRLKIDFYDYLNSVYVNGTAPLFTDGIDQNISTVPHGVFDKNDWTSVTIDSGFQPGINTLTFNWTGGTRFRLRVVSLDGTLN